VHLFGLCLLSPLQQLQPGKVLLLAVGKPCCSVWRTPAVAPWLTEYVSSSFAVQRRHLLHAAAVRSSVEFV
jgi:hypothetical protein